MYQAVVCHNISDHLTVDVPGCCLSQHYPDNVVFSSTYDTHNEALRPLTF